MIMVAPASTVVPILGTFDIAFARNTLRTKITQQRWPMSVNAHAAIAMTAIGELILVSNRTEPVLVTIEMIEDPQGYGVKLSSSFQVPDKRPFNWEEKKHNLQQACSQLDVIEREYEVEIAAYIWAE